MSRLGRWLRNLSRRLWPKSEATTDRRVAGPASLSPEGARRRDRERPGAGAGPTARPPDVDVARGRGLSLHLGIDFGTRFTKVCFRDNGRERSELVSFSSEDHPDLNASLLPSVIDIVGGRLTCGSFVDGSAPPRGVRIEFLKLLLAQLDAEAGARLSVPRPDGYDEQEIEGLATFYLAHVIQRSRQWIGERRAELLVGRAPEWAVSVGVPVQFFDSPARARFQQVLEMAMAWAGTGVAPEISRAELRMATVRLRRMRPMVPCSVVPEITAAVRSFVATPGAPEGVYLYLDVGAWTLDGVSFRFFRQDGRPRLRFYVGTVEHLGVSALAMGLAPVMGRPAAEIEGRLIRGDGAADLGEALGPMAAEIRKVVAGVILAGKAIERNEWSDGLEEMAKAFHRRRQSTHAGLVPLFVGGGGSLSPFYRKVVGSTYDVHSLENTNVRRYGLADIPQPQDLDMAGVPAVHFHRFAIAYGLSVPPEELPDVELPSEQDPARPRPVAPPRPGVVPYADSKEAFC